MANCKYCSEYVVDDENAGMDNDYNLYHPDCKPEGFIIFEGDYVTLTGEPEWLEVVEIVIVDGNRANNMLKLSDGYVVPAPVERYVDEVISKKEFIALS